MASSKDDNDDVPPQLHVTSPSFGPRRQTSDSREHQEGRLHRRRLSRSATKNARHVRLNPPTGEPRSSASSIYMGSYNRSPRQSRSRLGTPSSSAPGSPRTSVSHSHLSLLQDLDIDLETYGVEELRDGFFDGAFLRPRKIDHEDLMQHAEFALPLAFKKKHPLSVKHFLPKQWHDIKGVIRTVTTTRAGIKLMKSFSAIFIAYILCLVPSIRVWLGRYSYIMVLSAIINHPGRTIGAQLDGTFLTILGSATGLGWGALALWVSDSTAVAKRGYGGILATFLLLFMGTIAALRTYYIRMYQFVLCAGIAISYTCLADTSETIPWRKLFSYGIPWLFGQALCFLICCTVFPDAGARPLAVSLHDAFAVMQEGLVVPQSENMILHRRLALTFVTLSQAHRDLLLDVSITRFQPSDVTALRNLMQAVIRSFLSLRMEHQLFDDIEGKFEEHGRESPDQKPYPGVNGNGDVAGLPKSEDAVVDIDTRSKRPSLSRRDSEERTVRLVASRLAEPTSKLLSSMKSSLSSCDAVLLGMSGYRKYLGPPESISTDVVGALTKLRKTMIKYDQEEDSLMKNPALPPTYSDHPEVVELFLFVHPIRQAASPVEALLVKVMEMQQRHRGWRLYLPSYPFAKALQRTNAQVRHDRGGVTAGYYFHSQSQLARTSMLVHSSFPPRPLLYDLENDQCPFPSEYVGEFRQINVFKAGHADFEILVKGMANVYKPLPREIKKTDDPKQEVERRNTIGKYEEEEEDVAFNRNSKVSKSQRFRYRLWAILHRLQGFEMRFALKVAIVTSLLSVPAWLSQSRGWWNENESWWAVVFVWIMMHPRVGGNVQDLITRALCCILGAVWGGVAYGAGNGNPYVMAVFAAIYMIPMIYRFTQSNHPRSGIVGCISFVVVSLSAKAVDGLPSVVQIAWTRGLAFVVGVVAAVTVNWMLWPFVARHELRKALSAMLIYSSIIYRGVVAKYVYYEKGEEPTKADIERSEMLEGRLREGFVRIRQLMALTRHEIRLRGPFNPLPYSGLIDGCERFFEYLVAVRQSSLFFHPHYMSDNEQAAESLLAYRRDAVAAILMNLYVLAGALRGDRKVPRYLPSAAQARKHLLDHMAEIEAEQARNLDVSKVDSVKESRKWAQIYSYSYSQSLTGCVKQLEQLQKYTKEIVGEQGFDPIDTVAYGERPHE